VKKENGGQHFDDDILRCKEEILRLKSVVPPFGRPPKRASSPPAAIRQEPDTVIKRDPLPVMETARRIIDAPLEPLEVAAERLEQTAVQTMVEETAPQPTIQNVEFAEPEPGDIDAKEDDRENTQPLIEDSGILAALETEAAKTNPAPTPEPEPQLEPEPETESEQEPDDKSEIPEFNLAEQIMAAQRKLVGNRRKGPGNARFEIKEVEQEAPKPVNVPLPPVIAAAPPAPIRIVAMEPPMSPQQKVIAEIVARDIAKFY
jgi:hypothetical protein